MSASGGTEGINGFEPLLNMLKMTPVAADCAAEPEALNAVSANCATRWRTRAFFAASSTAKLHQGTMLCKFGDFRYRRRADKMRRISEKL